MVPPDSKGEPVGRFEWERAIRSAPMPPTRKLLLFIIGTYMARDGTGARPSVSTLAAEAGVGERQVKRHLTAALDELYLERVKRGHRNWQGQASASVYRATLPATCSESHLAHVNATCPQGHLASDARCHGEHCNVTSGALQGDTHATPPPPFEHSTTTAGIAMPIVHGAVNLLVRQEVAAEKKAGARISNIPSVAKYRIGEGHYGDQQDALARHLQRHPELDTSEKLLEHWRAHRRDKPGPCADPECVNGIIDTPAGAIRCEACR